MPGRFAQHMAAIMATCILLFDPMAHAEAALGKHTAHEFISRFEAALINRDEPALNGMLDDHARIVVRFITSSPSESAGNSTPPTPLVVTLSKAEYLQQLHALWHFTHDIQYDIGPVTYTANHTGSMTLSCKQTMRAHLFGNILHRQSRLKITLAGPTTNPRITAIDARTTQW